MTTEGWSGFLKIEVGATSVALGTAACVYVQCVCVRVLDNIGLMLSVRIQHYNRQTHSFISSMQRRRVYLSAV